MMFLGLIPLAFLIYGGYALFRNQQPNYYPPHNTSANPGGQALNILNERYARGEINDEEYQHKKAVLDKTAM
jgi:putative membrane protein